MGAIGVSKGCARVARWLAGCSVGSVLSPPPSPPSPPNMHTHSSVFPTGTLSNLLPSCRRVTGFSLLLAIGLLTGCSSNGLVPVNGKLLKGGKVPESGFQINFDPVSLRGEERAIAGMQLDGTFKMYTLPNPGVKPGEYFVSIGIIPLSGAQRPDKFGAARTSPWKVTVPRSGIKNLVLDFDKDEVVME